MSSAPVTPRTAHHGPSVNERIAAPTAWPVVPPGAGKLNIMMMKAKAVPKARSGICRVLRFFSTFLEATIQMGVMMAKKSAQVEGPRYPSGICTNNPIGR